MCTAACGNLKFTLSKKAKWYTVTTFKDGPGFPGRQKSAWLPMGGEDGVFL